MTSRNLRYTYIQRNFRDLVGRDSVIGIATRYGWTVRGSNPGGARFSAHPDRHWGPLRLLYNGYRVFPEGKVRPGRADDHSPPSSSVVLEEQSYNFSHPMGHNRAGNGNTLNLLLFPHNVPHSSDEQLHVMGPTTLMKSLYNILQITGILLAVKYSTIQWDQHQTYY